MLLSKPFLLKVWFYLPFLRNRPQKLSPSTYLLLVLVCVSTLILHLHEDFLQFLLRTTDQFVSSCSFPRIIKSRHLSQYLKARKTKSVPSERLSPHGVTDTWVLLTRLPPSTAATVLACWWLAGMQLWKHEALALEQYQYGMQAQKRDIKVLLTELLLTSNMFLP